ncbi:MAG: hypothetical protein RR101_13250 [Burkholderiaceae bacterium]
MNPTDQICGLIRLVTDDTRFARGFSEAHLVIAELKQLKADIEKLIPLAESLAQR